MLGNWCNLKLQLGKYIFFGQILGLGYSPIFHCTLGKSTISNSHFEMIPIPIRIPKQNCLFLWWLDNRIFYYCCWIIGYIISKFNYYVFFVCKIINKVTKCSKNQNNIHKYFIWLFVPHYFFPFLSVPSPSVFPLLYGMYVVF